MAACSTRNNSYGLLNFSRQKPPHHISKKREATSRHKDLAAVFDSSATDFSVDSVFIPKIFTVSMREDERVDHRAIHHVKRHGNTHYQEQPVPVSVSQYAASGKSELSEDWWASVAFVILLASVIAIGLLFLLALAPAVYNIINAFSVLGIVVGDILLSVSNNHVDQGRNKRTFYNRAGNIIARIIGIVFLIFVAYYVISLLQKFVLGAGI